MALSDYYLCDVCECKAFYDANLNYDFDKPMTSGAGYKLERVGDMKVLCDDCSQKFKLEIVERQ